MAQALGCSLGNSPCPSNVCDSPPHGLTPLYLASVVRKGRNWMFSTLLVTNIWRRSDLRGAEGSGLLGAQQCWGEEAPVSEASRHCTPSPSYPQSLCTSHPWPTAPPNRA